MKYEPSKPHKRIFKIADSIYSSRLWVVVNCSFYDVSNWYNKRYDKYLEQSDDVDGFHAVCYTKKHGIEHLVWTKTFDWEIYEEAILAHEILHFVFSVLGDAGMRLTPESGEAYTYFFQKTFQDCLQKMGLTNYEKLASKIKREARKKKKNLPKKEK